MTPIPSPRSKKKARIEIIPLIDIIFFLLATFVMVSLSMVKNRAIPLNLPPAATGVPQEHKDYTTISIDAHGAIFFDKRPIETARLDEEMKHLTAGDPDPKIFIAGDAKADLGTAIAVLDAARKLGVTKVAIETQPLHPPR